MLEQDYLVKMIRRLVAGMCLAQRKRPKDPELAADMLEALMGDALDMDVHMLLGLAPESFASIVAVSQSDPRLADFVAHTLSLEARYLQDAGDLERAQLRSNQAQSLAAAFGIELASQAADEEDIISSCEACLGVDADSRDEA